MSRFAADLARTYNDGAKLWDHVELQALDRCQGRALSESDTSIWEISCRALKLISDYVKHSTS
jgi:hypothetical protein